VATSGVIEYDHCAYYADGTQHECPAFIAGDCHCPPQIRDAVMLPTIKLPTQPAEGLRNAFMEKADTEAILALLHEIKPKRIVEFGINYGYTAREILARVPGIEEYIGIDIVPGAKLPPRYQWPEVPLFPGREVKGDKRVKVLVRPRGSRDVQPADIGQVDAAIIDGDHSVDGVLHDTVLAADCLRPGGLIIWHDYSETTNTDVPEVLHRFADNGSPIFWAEGTAVAFERLPP
jgi:predicted O-methyltransferase YrrM